MTTESVSMKARAGRASRFTAVLMLLAVLLSACMSPAQEQVHNLVNQSRASNRIHGLQTHGELQVKAQVWAERLAREGNLYHSRLSDGVRGCWRSLGENVGYGSSVGQVHTAYLNSSEHRANILSTNFTHMGTGVAWRGNRVYTVQVFMRAC